MAVKSSTINDQGQRQADPPQRKPWPLQQRIGAICLGVLAICIAIPGWVRGARYTVDGWRILLQALLDIAGAPTQLQLPTGGLMVGLVLGVGAAYSVAEVFARPGRPWAGQIGFWLLAALVWFIVIGSDVGTTLIGVLNTPATAWPPERWIAARLPASGIYALILTFYPETFTVGGSWLLWRAFR